jgi:hypothetical protein
MFENDFAYVTFVNNNSQYLNLLNSTVESIKQFSTYKLLIYFIDCPQSISKEFENEKIIVKHINNTNLSNVYYYKPYVIIDSIKSGLKSGYYIECDDVITPHTDSLYDIAQSLTNLPISPIHTDFPDIPLDNFEICNVKTPSQHYIHGHVCFKNTNIDFLEEWLQLCLKYNNFRNADETALNMIYWKYNCINHYLPIIDPWYENFYLDNQYKNTAFTFHGCKDPKIQKQLLEDMIKYYKKLN